MVTEVRYTTVPGKIKPLLDKIREVGRPDKATTAWLAQVGFSSSNDRTMLPILRQIGLVDGQGVPTDRWDTYRAVGGQALADGIRTGYGDLFKMYPNAHQRSSAELESFVKVQAPKLGTDAVGKVVATFRAVVALAEWSHQEAAHPDLQIGSGEEVNGDVIDVEYSPKTLPSDARGALSARSAPRSNGADQGPASVHVTLNLHLPELANADDYVPLMNAIRGAIWNGHSQ